MAIGLIIGAIISVLVSLLGIYFLVTVLEILKIVVLAVLIPFGFLWLWAFTKKEFKLDKYISAGLSFMVIAFTAVWIYQSWWALVGFGIIVAILYIAWKGLKDVGIMKIIKIIGEAT